MSTGKLMFTPKRVKIQSGWIRERSPKEENKFSHVGFSKNRKSVKLRTSTMCTAGSSSPSLARLPVFPVLPSPGKVPVLQSGGTRGVRELLSVLSTWGRGYAAALSPPSLCSGLVWFGCVCRYTYHIFAGRWLWTPHCLSTSVLLTNDSVHSGLPISPLCFFFSWILTTVGTTTGTSTDIFKATCFILQLEISCKVFCGQLFCASSALEHITYIFLLCG